MAAKSSFSIENVQAVLEQIADDTAPFPQEVLATDFKRVVAKTIEQIHPLAINQFLKGLVEIGAIRLDNHVVVVLMSAKDI